MPSNPQRSDTADLFSRREFVVRAGSYGAAVTLLPSHLRHLLERDTNYLGRNSAHPPLTAPVSPDLFSGLRWRMIGPFRGGRVAAVTGVPGRPNEFYFGAVNGGV